MGKQRISNLCPLLQGLFRGCTLLLSFLDGEAEQIVDDLFGQFATELPRSKLLHRFLPLSLVCYFVETDPAPHRSMPVACAPRKHPKRDSRVSHVAPIESIFIAHRISG